MNYMDTYQYTEIHANKLEIPKYCIRFLFIYLIVRKNGISREVKIYFTLFFQNSLFNFISKYYKNVSPYVSELNM
ncbi:hypothetical protein COL95_29630 [Bacillus anthracis]|nr:hypothetical protein COL95_29630 [Bacillus anthracis]